MYVKGVLGAVREWCALRAGVEGREVSTHSVDFDKPNSENELPQCRLVLSFE